MPRATKKDADLAERLRDQGRAEFLARRLDRAEALYRSSLERDPSGGTVRLFLAQALQASGKTAEAEALLRRALGRGVRLEPRERFKLLIRLRRFAEALRAAEAILDGSPTLADLRDFWDPWEWDERATREERLAELALMERAVKEEQAGPWLHYYRGTLSGPEKLKLFDPLDGFPPSRYGWMHLRAGMIALSACRFEKAEAWLEAALRCAAVDWRAHGFLAETRLCLGRVPEALAEMEKAREAAPAVEAGQVLAWRGAVDLWLGDYEGALARLERADAEGAQCAPCWLGAARLKLGRAEEALAALDRALELYPLDFEARVWRAEAKRVLGRPREALEELRELESADAARATPVWLWARVNRALARADAGDEAGMESDYAELPSYVRAYVRRRSGKEAPREVLEAALELSRGFRRDEYRQAIWMR